MKLALRLLLGLAALLALLVALLYRPDMSVAELSATYAQPPSQFMALDGMNVHYRVEGNPADSVPLLLLHGTGASLHTWDGWVKALRSEKRLIRLDLPGYALTGPHPKNVATGTYYADFLNRFLARLNVARCDVAGNSLGGNVAWHFALLHPARVRKLVMIDAAGYPFQSKSVPLGFKLARMPGLAGLLAHLTPDALFRKSLENVYANPALVSDTLVRQYADLNRRTGNRQAFVRRRPALDSLWQRIGQIRQPTLILWGAKDELIPPAVGQRFHRDLPNDTLIVYPDAGHVPMEELPARTAEDVRRFLKKL